MDINNPVVQLCIAGTQAEFQHKLNDAKVLYQQAWQSQTNDYEACIAAHYMARLQNDPQVEFAWNKKALEHAQACAKEMVKDFFPSLYVNMGKSFENLGDLVSAQEFYEKAEQLGLPHQMELGE